MRASFGSLAQLVEQRTLNPLVECSNHSRPTKQAKRLANYRYPFLFSVVSFLCRCPPPKLESYGDTMKS